MPKHKRGGRPLEPEVKAIRKMDRDSFLVLLNETWDMSYNELSEFVRAKRGTVGEQFVAACMLNGIKYGDTSRLTAIVSHMIGKPKDEVEVNITHEHVPIDRARLIEAIQSDPFIEVTHARLDSTGTDSAPASRAESTIHSTSETGSGEELSYSELTNSGK
jgi:hypothetical protein